MVCGVVPCDHVMGCGVTCDVVDLLVFPLETECPFADDNLAQC